MSSVKDHVTAEARVEFDLMIGRLDRLLSEFLVWTKDASLDEADRQTLKHHADDLVGVGNKALENLSVEDISPEPLKFNFNMSPFRYTPWQLLSGQVAICDMCGAIATMPLGEVPPDFLTRHFSHGWRILTASSEGQ